MKHFGGGDLFLLGFSIIIVVIASIIIFSVHRQAGKIDNMTFQYGCNGTDGKTINLTCPTGKTINVNSAVLADKRDSTGTAYSNYPNSVWNGGVCDPFNNDGTFNPTTTDSKTALAALSTVCNGKESCSYTIPPATLQPLATAPSGTICGGTGNTMLIGMYSCK